MSLDENLDYLAEDDLDEDLADDDLDEDLADDFDDENLDVSLEGDFGESLGNGYDSVDGDDEYEY